MYYLRQVAVDLISIEVGVVCVAVGVVHPDGLVARVAEHANAVGHDARLVKRRLTVHEHAVPVVKMPPDLHAKKRPYTQITRRGFRVYRLRHAEQPACSK